MEFITNIKREDYSEFVVNHEMSHFLKSYEWGQACIHRGLIPHYVGVKNEGKLVATALLLENRLPFGFSYFYIPRGFTINYKDYELIDFFTKKIAEYTKKRKSIFFKIDPDIFLHKIDKDAKVIIGEENNYELVSFFNKIGYKREKLNLYFENMQPRFTFRVNLDKPIDEIRNNYSKSVKRFIKQADKYNVSVKKGTKRDIVDFVRLMKLTEKRQGFFSHEYDFYEKLYNIFEESKSISIMIAKVDIPNMCKIIDEEIKLCENKEKKEKLIERKKLYEQLSKNNKNPVISSYVTINYGNKGWYLYGANDMDFKDTLANYKLFDYQIEYLNKLGVKIFDEFGTVGNPNTKKSVVGLHEFKKKFGGEYTEFIGEFTYVTNYFMTFIFKNFIPIYRKPRRWLKYLKIKMQGGKYENS